MGEVYQGISEIGAAGVHHTVREVKKLHGAVDNRKAYSNKGVDATGNKSVYYKLLKQFIPPSDNQKPTGTD